MQIISSSNMRDMEARAISGGVSADGLMEEAGLGISRAVRQFFPWPGLCLAVFGKGNNGGDALVAARHLSEAGWDVKLIPAFPQGEWGAMVKDKYEALGSPATAPFETIEQSAWLSDGRALVVLDGLLGTGSSGELRDPIRKLTRGINALRSGSHAHVFALDLPTGLNGDSGEVAGDCIAADTTLTIGFPKTGLVADCATNVVGRLAVIPLGMLSAESNHAAPQLATQAMLSSMLRRREFDSHKGDYGRVGIVAGSRGTLGAAVLCAQACLHAGAGLVTLYTSLDAAEHLCTMCPPEVMVQPLASLREVMEKRHDVLAVGPGLGSAHAAEVRDILERAPVPVVVDADALNALSADPGCLARAAGDRVLTPHPGEMERLAPGAASKDRLTAASEFAARFPKCTLLLKGARTVVAKAGQPLCYNASGHPGMAKGGMGDTLTGVIAALIGQQMTPHHAAKLGAWLCGRAAEIAIFQGGETEQTLTATRVAKTLPKAFATLRAGCF